MKKHSFVIAAILSLTCAVGCQSVNSTERADPQGTPQFVADHRVIADKSLNNRAGVVSVNEARTPSGLLQVQVQLFNNTSFPRRFRYTFEWYDDQGMLLPTPALWLPRRIMGGETLNVSSIAHTPKAVDFRFKIVED